MPARVVFRNVPDPTDHKLFPKDTLLPSGQPFSFFRSEQRIPPPRQWAGLTDMPDNERHSVEAFLAAHATTSFLVVRNDTILYEYYNGVQAEDPQLIFSLSKSVMSALVGVALQEGHIQSVDEPVANYLPEFGGDARRHIKIRHVLNMTSGLNHGDYEHPIKLGMLFYNTDQDRYVFRHTRVQDEPGTVFRYKSMDTQVLGMVLERATGKRVDEYLQEKIWAPMGAEHPAWLCLDHPGGRGKFYGGIAATARDIARFGRLYLHHGSCSGQQLVPSTWVRQCATVDSTEGSWIGNNFSWWLYTPFDLDEQDYYAAGFRGQLVYVDPNTNTIIVRQGMKTKGVRWAWAMARLAQALNPNRIVQTPPSIAEAYAGTYRTADGKQVVIEALESGELFVRGNASKKLGRKGLRLQPSQPTVFTNTESGLRTFFETQGKSVKRLVLDSWGTTAILQKVEDGPPQAANGQ